ncbi:hypothetical protein V3468_06070 [Flavobacterium oreochromis]|uniref:hypothetical protein n=1 Tax=Flavobacterium oreochromis TaxID=2906078 RepID=UPI00385CF576
MGVKLNYQYLKGEIYKAKVIKIESHIETERINNRTKTIKFHTPVFQFVDKKKNILKLKSSTSGTDIPIIGSEREIIYTNDNSTVLENSILSIIFSLFTFISTIILGFISLSVIQYALGKDITINKKIFFSGIFYGMKFGIMLFELLLVYCFFNTLNNGFLNYTLLIFTIILLPVIYLLWKNDFTRIFKSKN